MLKSFKEFFRSYGEVSKVSMKWLKEHWKGYTVLCMISFFVPFVGARLCRNHASKKELDTTEE